MEYTYSDGKMVLPNKELTILDKLVLKFLKAIDFDYVLISGYVAILLGRSRNTEDIDLFIEKISYEKFAEFCDKLEKMDFYMLNAEDSKDAYSILNEGISIRFAEKDTVTPNFEVKFPKKDTDSYSMEKAITVSLDGKNVIKIAPLELQIAYKLYLGSDKDYQDARHLYGVFKRDLNQKEFKRFVNMLNISNKKIKFVLGEGID